MKLRIGRLSGEGVNLIRSLSNTLNAQKVKPTIVKISYQIRAENKRS